MQLPGVVCSLSPTEISTLFDRRFADLEAVLGLHRFSWLPLAGADARDWAWAIWEEWCRRFAHPDDSWIWHPYTTVERALNILDATSRFDRPLTDLLLERLAQHARVIADRLEYFGDHYTGNHLANNGRGLLRIGLALSWPSCADMGAAILVNEAKRIFLPSGVLREGSSHYHLLLTRNYLDCWLAARRHRHSSAAELEAISNQALRVIPDLVLPAGMPLVGDISPDCPPEDLTGLLPGRTSAVGWTSRLDTESRTVLLSRLVGVGAPDRPALARDGWLRFDGPPWHGLWHLSPEGWSAMPGHGHQDAGSFELHWNDLPIFVDPGRGAYGEEGAAAFFRSARAHNGITIDGQDPYPANRPYFDTSFRQHIGGAVARLGAENAEVYVAFEGYRRLGASLVERRWHFSEVGFRLRDRVEGGAQRRIVRFLQTEWPVQLDREGALIKTAGPTLRVSADGNMTLRPSTRWTAYGTGRPSTTITVTTLAALPWAGEMTVRLVAA